MEAPVPVGRVLAPLELLGVVLHQPDHTQGREREDPDGTGPEGPAERPGDDCRQHEDEQDADDPATCPEGLHTRSLTPRASAAPGPPAGR